MAFALPYIVFVLAGALCLGGVALLWADSYRGRPVGFYLMLAAGLQFLLALPVAMFQGAFLMGPRVPAAAPAGIPVPAPHAAPPPGRIAAQPPPLRIALAVAAIPIPMGGLTVRAAFEAIHGPLQAPFRNYPSSAIAHGTTLAALTAFQVLAIGSLLAQWLRPTGNLADRRIRILGAAVILNMALNIAWPWWGAA